MEALSTDLRWSGKADFKAGLAVSLAELEHKIYFIRIGQTLRTGS